MPFRYTVRAVDPSDAPNDDPNVVQNVAPNEFPYNDPTDRYGLDQRP